MKIIKALLEALLFIFISLVLMIPIANVFIAYMIFKKANEEEE